MRRQAVIFLVLAIVAGGLAALLAARVLRSPPPVAQDGGPLAFQSVAVASRDLNIGHFLEPDDIRFVDWPAGAVPAGYSTSAAEVVGRGLLTPVRMNEPLLSEKLASPDAGGGLQIIIPDGKRAMSVRVDDVVGVAGFVLPGSRVDVLVTLDRVGQQDEAATRLVLQNLEVVTAGQSIERRPDGTPQQVPVVTLLVDPDEAEQLALAHSNGRLQLALRNPLDLDSTSTGGIRASQLLAGPPQPQPAVVQAAPRPAGPAPAPAAPAQPQRFQLEVYRGPQRSTSEVEQTLEAGGGGGS